MSDAIEWNTKGANPTTETGKFHAVVYMTIDGDFVWVVTPIVQHIKGSRRVHPDPAAFGSVTSQAEGILKAEAFIRSSSP